MKNNKKGFTLIELLVVVLIIGILAAIALPQYTKAVEKSRVSEALINLKAISDAAQRYYLLNGNYTSIATDALDIEPATNTNMFTFAFGTCSSGTCTVTATRKGSNVYVITYYLANGGFDTNKPAAGGSGRGCSTTSSPDMCTSINPMLK
jgi:type IV pilus assembly protein PilE